MARSRPRDILPVDLLIVKLKFEIWSPDCCCFQIFRWQFFEERSVGPHLYATHMESAIESLAYIAEQEPAAIH